MALIDVGSVTSWLITELLATPMAVGDGEAPLDAGWSEGVPNSGSFTPYVVIKQQPQVTSTMTDTPLCDANAVRFEVPYQLVVYDISRAAADTLASAVRDRLKALTGKVACGDLTANADQIRIRSVQGGTRDDSTFPKFWMASTNFTVNVARS
jgi:hypothetical protein